MNILDSKQLTTIARSIGGLALAALLLPGCPIYTDDGHRVACTMDSNCPTGQECISGTCQVPPCTSDADCATGQMCIAGSCRTVTPTCTSDRQCATGEHCEGMTCVPGTRVCVTHGDCDVAFMCDISSCEPSITCTGDAECQTSPAGAGSWCDYRGTCVPHGTGDCRTAADCTNGDLCVEGRCTTLPNPCQFQYDCPAGTACVNAECTAICTSDAGCVAGDTCSPDHFCQPEVDCETSAMCATGEHCVGGRCLVDCHGSSLGMCPTAGRETSYCGDDSFCHPSWQPAVTCTIDAAHPGPQGNCQTGRHCLAHVCRTPCPDGAMGSAQGNAQCLTMDSTLPYCLLDTASGEYLCNATMTGTASCRLSSDCAGGQDCVNAACQ